MGGRPVCQKSRTYLEARCYIKVEVHQMYLNLILFFYPSFIRPQCSFMGMVISHDMLLGRWRLSLELFGRVFMEDVGAEPGSVCSF